MSSFVQATDKRNQMLAMNNSQSGMSMSTRLHKCDQSWLPTPEFKHLSQAFFLLPWGLTQMTCLHFLDLVNLQVSETTEQELLSTIQSWTLTHLKQFRNYMKQKGEQELQWEMSRIELLLERNTREDENHHLQASTHKPPMRPKNSDHFLDQNAARKTGGPIVGPPVLRAGFATRKWALIFGPCQKI